MQGGVIKRKRQKSVPEVMNRVVAPYTRVLPIMMDDYCKINILPHTLKNGTLIVRDINFDIYISFFFPRRIY